ncbi:MAG: glutamine amidotransferase [Acidobacteriia bacterium]|nr:glutamine amidotransferase [Terriglobia bacterium]
MTAIFEFLFKYRPFLFEKGTIALRPPWPMLLTWVLAAAALAVSWFLYRRSVRTLPPSWKYILAGLRAVPLLVLIAIFLQPVLILHSVIPQKGFVAVVYDLSKSMEIRDGSGGQARLEVERQLLRPDGNPMLDELARKFKVRFFRFSGSAERVESFQDQPKHGNVTDLARALDQVTGELGSAPISGIVLITDGADNHSKDLNATAAQLRARNIPVYPIGIGSPSFSRDTEVLRVITPRKVLKDSLIEADVAVRSKGYAGRTTRLVVKEGDRLVHSQEIMLGSDDEVKTFKVNFSSESAGPKLFSFRVEPFPDEVVSENNDQSALVRVENEQPYLLYTDGEPRWAYAFLRRSVQDDKSLRLVTFLRQANGKFTHQGVDTQAGLEKSFPVDKPELFKYKGLILGSAEASFFTFDQLRMISDFVSQRGGGLLMIGGKNSFGQGGYVNTPLEDALPIALRPGQGNAPVPGYQDSEFKAELTSYGLEHPATRLSMDEQANRKRWAAAPPLVGINPTGAPKPGATVLAQSSVRDVTGQYPVLLAFQRFGRGKSMALTTDSTWRWRMEQEYKNNFHDLFWKQLLRWLVNEVPDQVNLDTDRHSYSPDESVVVRAEVNDESFMRLNNAQVTARVRAPSGASSTVPLIWDLSKEGQYSATYNAQEEGIYEVTAEAFRGSRSLGIARANFRIADSLEEYHNANLNSDLLKKLAADSGGHYYTASGTRTLPEDISYSDTGASRLEEKELWDMPIFFLLLAGAASAEWILRKRKGLA